MNKEIDEKELLKYMRFTETEVIFDKTFYENVIVPCMDNSIKLKQALNEIREYVEDFTEWDLCTFKGTMLKPVLEKIDKVLGSD